MGEYARYEIMRSHGVDIGDDDEPMTSAERRKACRAPMQLAHVPGQEKGRALRHKKLKPQVFEHGQDGPAYLTWDDVEDFNNQLGRQPAKEQDMDTNETISLLQITAGAKVFSARYLEGGNGSYHFKNVIGLDLKEGDLVVVESKGSYAVVKVIDSDIMATEVGCPFGALKHAVAKVHNEAYQAVLESEKRARHKLALSAMNQRLTVMRDQIGAEGLQDVRLALTRTPDVDAVTE